MARPADRLRYLKVGAALFVVVLAVYGGAWWLIHRAPERQVATSSPATSIGPASVTPIANSAPVATESPTRPVAWTVQEMTDPNTGRKYSMAPPEVVAMVRQDHQVIDDFYRQHVFDSTPEDNRRFFTGALLQMAIAADEQEAERGEASGRANLLRPDLQVLGFSADGLKVQVTQENHGETVPVYDRRTHQLLRENKLPIGVKVSTMVYDPEDRRWKVAESTVLEGFPGLR